ncbi:MAG: glycosyltransferase family 4 protein [Candidatus Zixiibacteriota bacterium]|nr:MAG: glycosyltransferase family 4 protein [candidate division Zixibacteria bacterium]
MKIALIHHQYVRKGGMESYLTDLVKGFSGAGDSVDLITSKVDPETPGLDRCRIIKNNVSVIPKPLRKYFFSRWLPEFIENRGYDLTLSVTRSSGQDIIVSGGTHRGFLRSMDIREGLLDRLEIALETGGYHSSRRIMAHSAQTKEEIVSLYNISPEKVFVLHPPLDCERFSHVLRKERDALIDRFGLARDRTTLLFASTGHRRKGLDLLVSALDMLPRDSFELIIAGSKPGKHFRANNIKYLGFVEQMEHLYAAADIVVLPSFYEPFGLVAVEAVQCGTPVVVSKAVGARDILNEDMAVVIDTLTPEAIAEAISKASEKTFKMASDFAPRHGLTLKEHIERIKKEAIHF